MEYSFSTVYTAIIASNIILILLTFVFRSKRVMINAGYRILALFVVMTLVRFLLPFEMPFTKRILFPDWISVVITWVRHPLFYIGDYGFCVWTILQIVWIIGFVVKLTKYIKLQSKNKYYILSNMWDVTHTEPYESLLQKICEERKRKNTFKVGEIVGLEIPILYGIVRPYILLPKNHNISEQDLYYILAHEASHHFHHDLITKFLVRLIAMIYWWNPFCHILTKQTDIILEMRVDDVITHSDERNIQDYLQCLIELKESTIENGPIPETISMPLFTISKLTQEDDMEKRFEMLIFSKQKKNHSLNIMLLALVLSLYLSSYAFIFEAFYAYPSIVEDTFSSTTDEFYAIQKEDNTYDIYFGELFIENTNSLDYYGEIQIYTE